jgi:hypothetical protein
MGAMYEEPSQLSEAKTDVILRHRPKLLVQNLTNRSEI